MLLPEHLSRLSLSFLVDTMDKRRGGCAPNIAYTLALLGERPKLMGTAGQDFGEYRQWLEAANIDTSLVKEIAGKFTASFFCSTDKEQQPDRVVLHRRDGQRRRAVVPHGERTAGLTIIAPNDPQAMVQYAEECRALGIRHIYDPGQQATRSTPDELRAGCVGATYLICNDYEFELIRQKTGLEEKDFLEKSEALIITKGEKGSTILLKNGQIDVPGRARGTRRRSDGRGRRLSRRPDERPRGRRRLGNLRQAGQRRGHVFAGTPGRDHAYVFVEGFQGALRKALRHAVAVASARCCHTPLPLRPPLPRHFRGRGRIVFATEVRWSQNS